MAKNHKRHKKGHHNHGWIVNSEDSMPVEQAAKLMAKLATKIEETRVFKLNGTAIQLPVNCHFVMRYERRPKGELVLKTEIVWHPEEKSTANKDGFHITD